MNRALILDCDGVIVDHEAKRHRIAFNRVWQELGIPWQWSEQQYRRALVVSGGRERLEALRFDPDFRAVFDVPDDPAAWRRLVAGWHRRKTEVFIDLLGTGVSPRSGIRRLLIDADAAGWRLVVATSGASASVAAVLSAALGPDLAARCALVTGDDVSRKKPHPEVFTTAAAVLGVDPADCVVVEDTRNGLLAAHRAGMTCVVTPTKWTFHDDFSEAALVVSGLGEIDGPPEVVLGGRVWTSARPYLTLAHLDELIRATQPLVANRQSAC